MPLPDWESRSQQLVTISSNPKVKLLLDAAVNKRKLHIRYSKPAGVDERWITPQRVFSKSGEAELYLEAYCHKRQASRTFMIKRIKILGSPESESREALASRTSSGTVLCSVDYVDIDTDYGWREGVEVTCNRCGHVTESFGTGSDSIRRCLALMQEECPRGESNWYQEE